jgi:tetratricopeptide (TPR) repeat protein
VRYRLSALLLAVVCGIATPALADERIEAIRDEVRAGNAKGAEALAEALLEAEPDNAAAHNVYGDVLTVRINEVSFLRKPGMAGRMRDAWERAVELDPTHLDARRSLMQYYLQAPAIAGGSRDKALAQAERIGEIDRAAGYRAMAAYWTAGDEHDKAAAEYAAAVEAFPEDNELRFEYGLYLQRAEDWDAAYTAFTTILESEPDELRARYQVGRNAVLSGERLEEGAAALEWYLGQQPGPGDPGLAWAHTRLGQVYAHMGRSADARAQFEAALAIDPEHEEARQALERVD